ncbi:hypothetical protein J6590_043120 [Homalodisca vitripennis]|nr:hypothetical protein J6590_043120 [Homalodisca vitripennis]
MADNIDANHDFTTAEEIADSLWMKNTLNIFKLKTTRRETQAWFLPPTISRKRSRKHSTANRHTPHRSLETRYNVIGATTSALAATTAAVKSDVCDRAAHIRPYAAQKQLAEHLQTRLSSAERIDQQEAADLTTDTPSRDQQPHEKDEDQESRLNLRNSFETARRRWRNQPRNHA